MVDKNSLTSPSGTQEDSQSDGQIDSEGVIAIDHCSLVVADTKKALTFYVDILGLSIDASRPDLGYPGAWLQVADKQIHLLELPNPDPVKDRPQHGGRDRHVAFQVMDLAVMIKRLELAGIAYTRSKSGRAALFCRDVDGNAIELIEFSHQTIG